MGSDPHGQALQLLPLPKRQHWLMTSATSIRSRPAQEVHHDPDHNLQAHDGRNQQGPDHNPQAQNLKVPGLSRQVHVLLQSLTVPV